MSSSSRLKKEAANAVRVMTCRNLKNIYNNMCQPICNSIGKYHNICCTYNYIPTEYKISWCMFVIVSENKILLSVGEKTISYKCIV
jgi:hypothetical protein